MEKVLFGKTMAGQEVYKYTLTNASGAKVSLLDYGCVIQSMMVPDHKGQLIDVVLGYDETAPYETNGNYFGAVIGRNSNRTANASYEINGTVYYMEDNENGNNLHSGASCYGRRVWDVKEAADDHISFFLVSPDGDGGFPGEFSVMLTYTWTDDNQLQLHYEGTCDQDTIVNMTNHSYFNLSGHNSGTVLDHTLILLADGFTPVKDSTSITTGEIWPVAGTPMDFNKEKEIGLEIDTDYEQLNFTTGYDHNYVLKNPDAGIRLYAKVKSPVTGIVMESYTDLPGVQFYAGNYISGPLGKDGAEYHKRDGFCLETQYYPNCANIEDFPGPILKKGEKYDSTTIYKFI